MAVTKEEKSATLTKVIFNNYVVKFRPTIKTALKHTITWLTRKAKALRGKKTKDDKERVQNEQKANRLHEQIVALRNYHNDDIAKFAILVKKTLNEVVKNPSSSIDEIAMTRMAYCNFVRAKVMEFRIKYSNWEKELPNIIKSLGVKYRKRRLDRMNAEGKLVDLLEREEKLLKLLHDSIGLDVDAKLLRKMKKPAITKENKVGENVANGDESEVDTEELKKVKKPKATKLKSAMKVAEVDESIEDDDESEDDKSEDAEDDDESEEEDENEDVEMSDVSLNKRFNKNDIFKKDSDLLPEITSMFKNLDDDSDDDDKDEDDDEDDDVDEEEEVVKKSNKKGKVTNLKNNGKDVKVEKSSSKIPLSNNKNKKLLKLLSNSKTSESTIKSSKLPSLSKESEIIKKQNKGTSKVKVLNLNKMEDKDEVNLKDEGIDGSSDEDEEFLKEDKITIKRKKTNFFLGRDDGEDEESGEGESEDESNENRKRKAEIDSEDEDISEYDSTKFSKKKQFRGEDSDRGSRGGRYGEDRGFRGRGRGEEGFRGRGGRGGFGQSGRNADDFTEKMTGDDVDNRRGGFGGRGRSPGGFRGRGRGGDRGGFGGRGRSPGGFGGRGRSPGGFGSRGREDRGGFGGRGRSPGGFGGRGRSPGGFGGRGRGGDRDGFGGRGRSPGGFGRGRSSGRGGFGDRGSSNQTPLGERNSGNSGSSMLHPSWAAKKSQSQSIASFQGKKVVFDN